MKFYAAIDHNQLENYKSKTKYFSEIEIHFYVFLGILPKMSRDRIKKKTQVWMIIFLFNISLFTFTRLRVKFYFVIHLNHMLIIIFTDTYFRH